MITIWDNDKYILDEVDLIIIEMAEKHNSMNTIIICFSGSCRQPK
jgi:hypothetical protein